MNLASGGLARMDARPLHGRRSVASRYVMDDESPENAFRDALIAFAEKYAIKR
jgi:hypothetical protein